MNCYICGQELSRENYLIVGESTFDFSVVQVSCPKCLELTK